ncbi:MAG: type II secretion system protein [Erysipelotrichaceae bacterium]
MKNKEGFTLIELIVVIAILGVLALILVPNFMGYLADAKKTTAKTNATNAYKIAAAKCATGQSLPAGGLTVDVIQDAVVADYKGAVVSCNMDAAGKVCVSIKQVTVTSSGIEATADQKTVTIKGESA